MEPSKRSYSLVGSEVENESGWEVFSVSELPVGSGFIRVMCANEPFHFQFHVQVNFDRKLELCGYEFDASDERGMRRYRGVFFVPLVPFPLCKQRDTTDSYSTCGGLGQRRMRQSRHFICRCTASQQ